MKKILSITAFLLLMLVSLSASTVSNSVTVPKTYTTVIDTITSATTENCIYTFSYKEAKPLLWVLQVSGVQLSGTMGVKIQVSESVDGVNYTNINAVDTLTNSTKSFTYDPDTTSGFRQKYIKVTLIGLTQTQASVLTLSLMVLKSPADNK